jgi:Flp pilus assembly protein TadD
MLASRIVPVSETIMRVSSVALAAALTIVCVSTSLTAQRPDDQIDARSLQLLAQGKAARAAGNFDAATDLLETAVAVDPRNRAAFVVLAVCRGRRSGYTARRYCSSPTMSSPWVVRGRRWSPRER